MWNTEYVKKLFVPFKPIDIEQHRPRCVRWIGYMQLSACEVPNEPRVHRTESQVAVFSPRPGTRYVVQEPYDLACAEIRIYLKTRLRADCLGMIDSNAVAEFGRTTVLPHNGVMNRDTGAAIPNNRCFTLVCDADRGDLRCCNIRRPEGLNHCLQLILPYNNRIVLDP